MKSRKKQRENSKTCTDTKIPHPTWQCEISWPHRKLHQYKTSHLRLPFEAIVGWYFCTHFKEKEIITWKKQR